MSTTSEAIHLGRELANIVTESDQSKRSQQLRRVCEQLESVLSDSAATSESLVSDVRHALAETVFTLKQFDHGNSRLYAANGAPGSISKAHTHDGASSRKRKATRSPAVDHSIPDPTRLPAEVILLIVEYAQSPSDFYTQQRNNMSFMRISRDWHQVVAPLVRSEIHLTRGHEYIIERLDRLRLESPERNLQVKVFSVDIDFTNYMWRSDGQWYGRLLPKIFEWLGNSEICHFRIRQIPLEQSAELVDAGLPALCFGRSDEFNSLVGKAWPGLSWFDQRSQVVELHFEISIVQVQGLSDRVADSAPPAAHAALAMYLPGPELRRLYIKTRSPWYLPTSEMCQALGWDHSTKPVPHPWEVLSAPHALITPRNLLRMLRPVGWTFQLTRLDISIDLHSILGDPAGTGIPGSFEDLARVIVAITPTIRSLYLYLFDYPNTAAGSMHLPTQTPERDARYKLLVSRIASMPRLHTLSLGGAGVSTQMCARTLRRAKGLIDLTLLPTLHDDVSSQDMRTLEALMTSSASWNLPSSGARYRFAIHEKTSNPEADMIKLLAPERGHFQSLKYLTVFRKGLVAPKADLIDICRERGIQLKTPVAYRQFWSRGPLNRSGLGAHHKEVPIEDERFGEY